MSRKTLFYILDRVFFLLFFVSVASFEYSNIIITGIICGLSAAWLLYRQDEIE